MKRPNVLYIHSHDTGRCTEPYGFPVRMPACQQLAEQGTLFRNAFSASPTCSPSRSALLTGQSPHSAGMLGLAHRGFDLAEPRQHLATYLKSLGYRTVLAGHQHVTSGDPALLGYETVSERFEVPGERVAANASEFLEAVARADAAQPFFLDVGFTEAHRPFLPAPRGASRYTAVLPGLPDIPAVRSDVADFHESLRALDRAVGNVLAALEQSGMAGRTIVILTTDHGPAFPGMKSTLTDAGLGVGLVLRFPGITTPGTVSDGLVSQIDLYPTICDYLGVPAPEWLQGVSLLPLIDGSRTGVRTETFGEITFHAAYEPQRSVRTNRWLYIRRFGRRSLSALPNVDASPALDWLVEHDWHQQSQGATQLYDCATDPLQRVNLAGTPAFQEIERDLAERLQLWMETTNDPLLDGAVRLPPGGFVNRASDSSPDGELVSNDFE